MTNIPVFYLSGGGDEQYTPACEEGTKIFFNSLKNPPKNPTIRQIIELTKDQYGHDKFSEFFEKKGAEAMAQQFGGAE